MSVVAAGPAAAIFSAAGLSFRPSAASGAEALLREAEEILRRLAPEAVLVGLSGPEPGIDEALLAQARGVPSFALQDYWGDVNPGFGRLADVYLVVDEEARELTLALHGAAAVVVGAPKYAAYDALDPPGERLRARARLALHKDAPLVGFFGQDLWAFVGYARTLRRLAGALAASPGRPALLYRPHPKEPAERMEEALALFRDEALDVRMDAGLTAEQAACACDVATTVYSTLCYDAAHLNRVAAEPMASPLYLLFEADLQARLREHTGVDFLPPARDSVCGEVRDGGTLGQALVDAIGEDGRAHYWRRARTRLRASADAVDAILGAVAARARPAADGA